MDGGRRVDAAVLHLQISPLFHYLHLHLKHALLSFGRLQFSLSLRS
jgi:hypothetical protein